MLAALHQAFLSQSIAEEELNIAEARTSWPVHCVCKLPWARRGRMHTMLSMQANYILKNVVKRKKKNNQAKIFHSLSRYIAVLHARKQVQKEKALLSVDNKKIMNVECCLKRKLKQTKTKHKVPRILRKVNPTRQVQ